MLLISVAILVSGICVGLGHDHGPGHGHGRLEQPNAHFQGDDPHEDHRHWYTKESNEKLQDSLQKAKRSSEMETNKGDEEESLSKPAGRNSADSHHHKMASHGHGCGGHNSHSHGQAHSHGDPHEHEHSHGGTPTDGSTTETSPHAEELKPKALSTRYVWLESIVSTCLISAAPFFILFFVPLESNSAEQRPLLKILLSFASGGLLGDAFLHLIPHAISPHSHNAEVSHSHSHHSHRHDGATGEHVHDHSADMVVGLWVLAGMVAFLIVEKFVRHIKGGHSHSHSHHSPVQKEMKDEQDGEVASKTVEEDNSEVRHRKKEPKGDPGSKENTDLADKSDEIADGSIKVSGYLNLAADFTHNFTDGLAIGASYLVSRNVGFITTLTILLHEVPHEIGDFAILVQSGCSKRKAMWLQLTTATGALAGTVCGLLAQNIGNAASSGILPFTAGGFIYIATVSVIPELLEDSNPKQSIKEVVALLVGVLLMVVIAMLE